MGPTVWTIIYDDVLSLVFPVGLGIVRFADDLALVATGKTEEELMRKTNIAIKKVDEWLERKNLKLAPERTEAVLLTGNRKIGPTKFKMKKVIFDYWPETIFQSTP